MVKDQRAEVEIDVTVVARLIGRGVKSSNQTTERNLKQVNCRSNKKGTESLAMAKGFQTY